VWEAVAAIVAAILSALIGYLTYRGNQQQRAWEREFQQLRNEQEQRHKDVAGHMEYSAQLHELFETQSKRATEIEQQLRNRLHDLEAEHQRLFSSYRDLQKQAWEFDQTAQDCKRQSEKQQQKIEAQQQVIEGQERKIGQLVVDLQAKQEAIDNLKARIAQLRLVVQQQSIDTEKLRAQAWQYEAPETKELGPLPNGTDTDTPEH
jgi:chromosome segregation ATPase